jgi:hypothetical protein
MVFFNKVNRILSDRRMMMIEDGLIGPWLNYWLMVHLLTEGHPVRLERTGH